MEQQVIGDIPLGVQIVRGENVVMMGDVVCAGVAFRARALDVSTTSQRFRSGADHQPPAVKFYSLAIGPRPPTLICQPATSMVNPRPAEGWWQPSQGIV